jgi:hypothetical protein
MKDSRVIVVVDKGQVSRWKLPAKWVEELTNKGLLESGGPEFKIKTQRPQYFRGPRKEIR